MRRGAWHQCGDRSQKLVKEQLERQVGVGVVLSPRDLSLPNAVNYTGKYRALGADVLLDQQFYVPDFTNSNLSSYPITNHRAAVSSLNQISDAALDSLASDLEQINRQIGVSAVVAPAVIYQAGRSDIESLNARLFHAAKRAGDSLGVPTYATIVLGRSVTSATQTLAPVLSSATALSSDGWYFAFEFDAERVPSDRNAIERAGRALLTLACTGRPVLHAYAGPLSLLSFGFGAVGAGIGHSQNTWRFTPERWQPTTGGGGGDAPARFFSTGLWGTIVYPDETSRLPAAIAPAVLTHSPFSGPVAQNPALPWSRWDANKHLVYLQSQTADRISQISDARGAAAEASQVLAHAVQLHAKIAAAGSQLADNTNAYQSKWLEAVSQVLADAKDDYDYLDMMH